MRDIILGEQNNYRFGGGGRGGFPRLRQMAMLIAVNLTETIQVCNNNCTIYYIPSVHNNINIVI